MKIVFDSQIFGWQQYGGISRYFSELADYFAHSTKEKVKIFSPFYVNEYISAVTNHPFGIKVPNWPRFYIFYRWANFLLGKLTVRNLRDVDIFHETYYSFSDICPPSAKRVITVLDMTHEKFMEFFAKNNPTSLNKAYAVHRADHIICISENTRQDLITLLGVPKEKTSVVYLGWSLNSHNDANTFQPPRKPFVLFVGQRPGYKNFQRLLKVFAHSKILKKDFSLVCFGGGRFSEEEKRDIESLRLSLYDVIQISGDDNLLGKLYSRAAVFVYPSLYEGFGIPLLEAMAFDCPVACSNTSSFPEVVGNAAELFDPIDESDIMRAIEGVLLSAERSSVLIQKGKERIKLFSWEKCAQETLQVYRKILRGQVS